MSKDNGELIHKMKNSSSFAIISQSDIQESEGNDVIADKFIGAPRVNLKNKKQDESEKEDILDELDELF